MIKKISFLFFISGALFASTINVKQYNDYNELNIDKDLKISVATNENIIKKCIHCNSEWKFIKENKIKNSFVKKDTCKNVKKQSFNYFKKNRTFKVVKTTNIYKEPVECPSLKIGKIKKGTVIKTKKYTKYGWIGIDKGWIKGYQLLPKFNYKYHKKCDFCQKWK